MHIRKCRALAVFGAILIAAALSLPIAAVTGALGNAEAADEIVLRIGFMQKIDSLNPFLGLTDAAYVFYGLVYDALHGVGNDLETEANLATSWHVNTSYSPYGSAWDFNITPNAKWHDGEPLTVDDILYTVYLNSDYYQQAWAYQPYAYYMDEALIADADTVTIKFFDRVTGFPKPASYADLVCVPIMPKHALQGVMTPENIATRWTGVLDSNPPIIGTGPFMATSTIYQDWVDGDVITLVRNPNYHWAADKVGSPTIRFDRLEMRFYNDATAMSLALERKQLDIAQFPPSEYQTIKAGVASGSIANTTTYDGLKCTQYWTEIGFSMAPGGPNPTRLDPAVRHALAMATDKDYIVDNFYLGFAEPGTTLISPVNSLWHYEPTMAEKFQFSLAAADQMLEDAGYQYTTESPNVRVATASSLAVTEGWVQEGTPLAYDMLVRQEFPEEKDIAQYLQDQWADVGVSISFRVVTEAQLSTIVYTYNYDTMIWYWSADPDPNFMLFCQSKLAWDGWSDNYYYSDVYEDNYSLSVSEFDYDLRKQYVDSCQRVNYLDAAYILLAYAFQTYAWRNDTFSGWGDWAANPGRSVDAFWTGNPLYFDLVPIGNGGDEGLPIIYVAVGAGIAVAAVAAVVYLMKTKKKGGSGEGESPLGD